MLNTSLELQDTIEKSVHYILFSKPTYGRKGEAYDTNTQVDELKNGLCKQYLSMQPYANFDKPKILKTETPVDKPKVRLIILHYSNI